LRIFATPLNKLLGRVIKDRMTRLLVTASVLVVFFCAASCVFSMTKLSELGMIGNVIGCLIGTIPCAILWVAVEYRYGGTYKDLKNRLQFNEDWKNK
jgi:hypothetical protein